MSAMETPTPWLPNVRRLIRVFASREYNQQTRMVPWRHAAHKMAQGWHLRLGTPPARRSRPTATRPTWKAFALRAADIAARKVRRSRTDPWHAWASRRVTPSRRYLRKSAR